MPPVQKKCPRRLPDGLAAREKYGKHIVLDLVRKNGEWIINEP